MIHDLRERFKSVAEDLDHLATDWLQNPPDSVVRRGSVILRRLLAEGVLQRAWKAFGLPREPVIAAPNLDLILGVDRARVEIATAGGADIGGVWAAGAILAKGNEPHENPHMPDNALEYPFALRAFTESSCVLIDGQLIVRREIVKYFAHFEGGAHLQLSSRVRKADEDLARRIKGWQPRFNFNGRDGLYTELLAIGQCVGKSEDMRRLAGVIHAHRPGAPPSERRA